MLAGAVNTALVGSNGVLNRVSEDGVLSEWFRAPHRTYGTTSRLISLIVLLQLVAIIASRGDVYLLGEAYAFGVIWSFAFKALAVLVLRFTDRSPRVWKVPCNLDVIRVALRHLAADLSGPGRTQLLATFAAPRAAPHAPQAALPRTRRRA